MRILLTFLLLIINISFCFCQNDTLQEIYVTESDIYDNSILEIKQKNCNSKDTIIARIGGPNYIKGWSVNSNSLYVLYLNLAATSGVQKISYNLIEYRIENKELVIKNDWLFSMVVSVNDYSFYRIKANKLQLTTVDDNIKKEISLENITDNEIIMFLKK